jgi:hypothetical protein
MEDETLEMLDLIFVAVTVGFFWLSWRYAKACERV